jgi:hypothetical protein
MTSRLTAVLAGGLLFYAGLRPCAALQETEFVRTLPTAYVPDKPMTVFLVAHPNLCSEFHAELHEFIPAGWTVVSSDPQFTHFSTFTGQPSEIFWRIDKVSPIPLWHVAVTYDVVPPAGQQGEVAFDGYANYHCAWWEDPRSAATTGDTALSPGAQQLRLVPGEYPSIQAAIDASQFGDTVVVASSVYVEYVEMKQGVDLKGQGHPPPEIRSADPSYYTVTSAPHSSLGGFVIRAGIWGVDCVYSPFEVRDCVITGTTSCAVSTYVGRIRIVNCTIVGNSGDGVDLGGEKSENLLINSILFANAGRDVSGGLTRFSSLEDEIYYGSGDNNILGDPTFVDPAAGDYRLLRESPCIDAGDSSVIGPDEKDIEGKPRILFGGKASAVDMGAYEYWLASASPRPDSSAIGLSWSNHPGKTYSVFFSEDMVTWQPLAESVPSSGDSITSWQDSIGWPPTVPMRFYRISENE